MIENKESFQSAGVVTVVCSNTVAQECTNVCVRLPDEAAWKGLQAIETSEKKCT
jgi:hypothetical protein